MTNPNQRQQGDVVFQRVEAMPAGKARQPGPRGYVLAEGEATGHAHCVEVDAGLLELREGPDGSLYARIGDGGATVTHEEHGSVTIPAGTWQIGRVEEYDHFTEEAREVMD